MKRWHTTPWKGCRDDGRHGQAGDGRRLAGRPGGRAGRRVRSAAAPAGRAGPETAGDRARHQCAAPAGIRRQQDGAGRPLAHPQRAQLRGPRHRPGRRHAAVRLQRLHGPEVDHQRVRRVRPVPPGRGRRWLRRHPGRPRGQLPRRCRLHPRLHRTLCVLQGRAAAAADRARRQAAGRVPDRPQRERRARVPLVARQQRGDRLHRRARRTRHRAAATVRLRMDPRHQVAGSQRALPAPQHPRHPVRRDHRRRPHPQGREQHRDRRRHLQRIGRGRNAIARRCADPFRQGRCADPAEGAALPRDHLARAGLQHIDRQGGAPGRDRPGLHPVAGRPRHHFSRRLLPAERRAQGLRRRRAGHAVQADDPLAERRGRALCLLRARLRPVRAAGLQHDPAPAAAAGARARLRTPARRPHGALPRRERRPNPRPPDAGLADPVRLRRIRGGAPAGHQLHGPDRQCRTGARGVQPARPRPRHRARGCLRGALRIAGAQHPPAVRHPPLDRRRAMRRPVHPAP